MFFKKKKPQEKGKEASASNQQIKESKNASTSKLPQKDNSSAVDKSKQFVDVGKQNEEFGSEANVSTTSIMQNSRVQEIQREYDMKKRELDGNRNIVPLDKEEIIIHLVDRLEKAENSIAESQYSLAMERELRNKLAFDLEEKSKQLDELIAQQSIHLEQKIKLELQKTLSIAVQAKLEAETKYNKVASENVEKTLLITELDRQVLETRVENNYLRQENTSMIEMNKEMELNFLDADNKKNEWMQCCHEKDYMIEQLMKEISELKGTLTKFADVRQVLNRIMGAPDVITTKEKMMLNEYNESYIRSMEKNLSRAGDSGMNGYYAGQGMGMGAMAQVMGMNMGMGMAPMGQGNGMGMAQQMSMGMGSIGQGMGSMGQGMGPTGSVISSMNNGASLIGSGMGPVGNVFGSNAPAGNIHTVKKGFNAQKSDFLANDDDFWYSTTENPPLRDYAGPKKYQTDSESFNTKFPPIPRKNSPSLNWENNNGLPREVRSGGTFKSKKY